MIKTATVTLKVVIAYDDESRTEHNVLYHAQRDLLGALPEQLNGEADAVLAHAEITSGLVDRTGTKVQR